MLRGPPLSGFTFLQGARHMYRAGRSLYEGGRNFFKGPLLQLSHSHMQTKYAGTRELIWRWAGVACCNCLFAWSILTRCRSVGGVYLPWGKGLNRKQNEIFKLFLRIHIDDHQFYNFVANLPRSLQNLTKFMNIICMQKVLYTAEI